ncbi:hypothetical protein [Candidatus Clostridium stratigraminis]|uniref:Uncharacterized protein n=1 Tax=Candidatus Clostridium stratigraminis TaxID=3381661 RepID=A0ABW8SZR6_9CLOT
MEAVKGNKVYSVDETSKASYAAQGYDILDDEGNVVEYGAGRKVDYKEYKELEEKCEKLEKENKKLKQDLKKATEGA